MIRVKKFAMRFYFLIARTVDELKLIGSSEKRFGELTSKNQFG
jgi:hypothetical protein